MSFLGIEGVVANPAYGQNPYHTVTFAENDNASDEVIATETENTPTDLTSFSTLGFSDSGENFSGWNTEADGSGTAYSDEELYSFDSALTLYAQWTRPYETVTFAENDSPADEVVATQTENTSASLTLFVDLTPSFSNPGFTFDGWNTAMNGSGSEYSDGATFDFTSATILYAQWSANQNVTATFGDNGGSGSAAPVSEGSGSSITLPSASTMSRTDFVLSGWNTQLDGSGTEYAPGATVVLSANETFYAQWTETSPLTIAFLDNGGTGTDPGISGELGTVVQLPGVTTLLTYTGYTLSSWNTEPDGSGTSYALSQSVTLSAPLILYAQWIAAGTVTVSLSANGGSGSLTSLSGEVGTGVTLPGVSSVVRTGYTLSSWNTAANGSGTSYAPGQTFNLTSNVTLYAQWTRVKTSVLYGSIGVFGERSAALTPTIEREVRTLATVIKAKGYTKVVLLGYTAETGSRALDRTLSVERANRVGAYLRTRLHALHVTSVRVSGTGEGTVGGSAKSSNSRVEVFVS